jgi:hypothetical protein
MADDKHIRDVWRTAVSSTEGCLSVQQLERMAAGTTPGEREGVDHLNHCPHCQAELAMLKSFESAIPAKNEGAAVAWIAAQLNKNPERPYLSLSGRLSMFMKNFVKTPHLVAGMAVALIAIFSVSLYIFERPQAPKLVAGNYSSEIMRSGAIRLVEPAGDLTEKPASFKWEPFAGAKSYSLELKDVNSDTLWTGNADTNFIAVGSQIKAVIPVGRQLVWKVTALDVSGKTLADSSQGHFRVIPAKE